MILLANTSSKIQVITGSAVTSTVMHASWVDNASGTITPGATNSTTNSAVTTDAVGAPGASTYRNVKFITVRNTNATTSNTITIQHTDGTTVVILWSGTLGAGMQVSIDDRGIISVFSASGLLINPLSFGAVYNNSTSSVSAGYSADTYLAGSSILIPVQRPKIGTRFRCMFDMTKTAAGTATPIVTLRYGTNASTADTALCAFTFSAGTAATDTGMFVVEALYRSVGSGTSAVVQGHCRLVSQPTTGLSSLLKGVATTSSGHDSTTVNTYLGVSFNGGASFSGTNTQVMSSIENI